MTLQKAKILIDYIIGDMRCDVAVGASLNVIVLIENMRRYADDLDAIVNELEETK